MRGPIVIFLGFLTTFVCGNPTPDDDWKLSILTRLEDLEQYKRESTAKIEALSEVVLNHEATIKTHQATIKAHETTIENHESKINSLEQEILVQQAAISRQGKLLQKTRKTMKSLLNASRNNPSINAAAGGNTDFQKSGIYSEFNNGTVPRSQHNQAVRTSSIHSTSKRQGIAGGIAFTAYLDHDVDLGAHQTIKFNQVITNEANGYNPTSGVFTCVESGVYLVYAAVGERGSDGGARIEIVVNNKNLIDSVVDTKHATQDLQGSNMVVVRLNQGDSVWVDSNGVGDHVEGSSGLRLTTFTVVFLYYG